MEILSGFANINGAQLYYETAGNGTPFLMIHAGVADSRQWEQAFAHFAADYQAIRYDLRGYGKSEPVAGDFNHLDDLNALLAHLGIDKPLIVMGCSMGGGLAMDFALAQPHRVHALIMVGSGPNGLELDVPEPALFQSMLAAYEQHDWDQLADIEIQLWFDGEGRSPEQVNQVARQLAYAMNRQVLAHEAKGLGQRQPNLPTPSGQRIAELNMPVLVVVGEYDVPYILAAADYMLTHIPHAQKVVMHNAAHLPNMEHPAEFEGIVGAFLAQLG